MLTSSLTGQEVGEATHLLQRPPALHAPELQRSRWIPREARVHPLLHEQKCGCARSTLEFIPDEIAVGPQETAGEAEIRAEGAATIEDGPGRVLDEGRSGVRLSHTVPRVANGVTPFRPEECFEEGPERLPLVLRMTDGESDPGRDRHRFLSVVHAHPFWG